MSKFKRIECATDIFKTSRDVPYTSGLGDFKLESEGLLRLIRPKLNVFLRDSG
jgi:hypothetical protein